MKRRGSFPYQNAKRPRYSSRRGRGSFASNPPNLLTSGGNRVSEYRTTNFSGTSLPARNSTRGRRRPPPQRSTSQRKPPPSQIPATRKIQEKKKSPVKVPLFPNQGIPAQKPVKKTAPKKVTKKAVPKQAPKKTLVKKKPPEKLPSRKAPAKKPPTQKVLGKKKVAPKPKRAQPKMHVEKARTVVKPKPAPVKEKKKAAPTKAMKPSIDLQAEIRNVVTKEKSRGEDELGWEIHPELLAPVNVTGKWRSTAQTAAGAFNFEQKGDTLSGSIEMSKTPCTISGKIDAKNRTFEFLQKFHKLQKVTTVEVNGSVELTVMKTAFSYADPDGGESVKKGEATLVQEPTGKITGVWAPMETPINFHIFHYPNGLVLGYLDKPGFCQVFGTLVKNKLRIQQEWVGKGSKVQCIGEVVGDDYLVLVYGYINGDGKLETGTTKFYRKKGKLPDPPKVWEVSLVVDSNVREEMKFTPQTEIIKRTFPAPSKVSSFSKNVTDNGVTEIEGNAEFCLKSGDITWHRERFTKQILTRPIPYGVKLTKKDNGSSHYPLYYPDMKILVLGEADFSFTLGLALKLKKQDSDLLPTLVGTSFLEKADVPRNIMPPNFQMSPLKPTFINENSDVNHNLLTITESGAHVRFGVDARAINQTLRQGENAFCSPHALPRKFDRIIFPFPRASLKRTNWSEENALLHGLFLSSKRELTNNGELHMILHNSKLGINQFDMWGIRELAEDCGYVWRASLPFNFRLIPPYYPKDVSSNKWTPFEASIHVFTVKDSGWKPEKRLWRSAPSKETKLAKNLENCPPSKKYATSKFKPGVVDLT